MNFDHCRYLQQILVVVALHKTQKLRLFKYIHRHVPLCDAIPESSPKIFDGMVLFAFTKASFKPNYIWRGFRLPFRKLSMDQ